MLLKRTAQLTILSLWISFMPGRKALVCTWPILRICFMHSVCLPTQSWKTTQTGSIHKDLTRLGVASQKNLWQSACPFWAYVVRMHWQMHWFHFQARNRLKLLKSSQSLAWLWEWCQKYHTVLFCTLSQMLWGWPECFLCVLFLGFATVCRAIQ